MAVGGTGGLALGALLAPKIGWRGVFWIAGGPSLLLALLSAFIAAPARLPRPTKLPARAYLLSPTYILALAGGILATFGASGLIFWARWLIIDERHFSRRRRQRLHGRSSASGAASAASSSAATGATRSTGARAADTRCAIGLSMLIADPVRRRQPAGHQSRRCSWC